MPRASGLDLNLPPDLCQLVAQAFATSQETALCLAFQLAAKVSIVPPASSSGCRLVAAVPSDCWAPW